MKRALLALGVIAGCKAGNFLTVEVTGIPCDASSLHVSLELDGGAVTDYVFTSATRIDDGASSFAIDLGGHRTGLLLVTVEAISSSGQFSQSVNATLPATSVSVDLGRAGTCARIDAGVIDAGVAPDADLSCGWSFEPANFAPCASSFPQATGPIDITGTQTLDTDAANGKFSSTLYMGTSMVVLIHATTFTMEATSSLQVTGKLPLLIVADDGVVIKGAIDLSTAVTEADCTIIAAPDGAMSAAGGGGGGFATAGGAGGDNSNPGVPAHGPPGGGAAGNALLVPLRPGCPGGKGGDSGSATGGAGGLAGGALEISSKTTLELGSMITANGGGGAAGMPVLPGNNASGGGGGGAGGAVLLEASAIMFVSGSAVCALGGGGGQGADVTMAGGSGISAGTTGGMCVPGAGGANGGGTTGGTGGTGGGAGAPRAGMNGNGLAKESAGGGGGGAAGRIRIHGAQSGTAMIVPPPS